MVDPGLEGGLGEEERIVQIHSIHDEACEVRVVGNDKKTLTFVSIN